MANTSKSDPEDITKEALRGFVKDGERWSTLNNYYGYLGKDDTDLYHRPSNNRIKTRLKPGDVVRFPDDNWAKSYQLTPSED